jgi:hypothetical protein
VVEIIERPSFVLQSWTMLISGGGSAALTMPLSTMTTTTTKRMMGQQQYQRQQYQQQHHLISTATTATPIHHHHHPHHQQQRHLPQSMGVDVVNRCVAIYNLQFHPPTHRHGRKYCLNTYVNIIQKMGYQQITNKTVCDNK